ncbi:hypothetical protein BKA67DRAFT_537333 [Truncatella angustata]|uniref:SsuA/THI5-like domain-containing protein n=1 Tax=Truncatella angustata TaxID=152316 RepID=A0A9P8UG01_9PEZI|nr:uncharacterized protein BKA67DRAFT_537333 [Truncatella angustata]KAH6651456.1 hypothetical protein BKA67DRAFT_537333 [Truncatella angustata]KAH8203757.1 hypothetical protein TruAng_002050 [Truncatella angustata]
MHIFISSVAYLSLGSFALDTVQYGAFLATGTYSIANQLGFFTANGLNVVYNQVPNSTAAFQSLLNGQYDILTATVDNALNYRFNQGQNVTVAGQLDQGPDLVIASVPSITDITQLKGKPIIVDSPSSGYAYLLRNTLAANGLYLNNSDYYFMTVGGTSARYSALINGSLPNGTEVYATILNYPFTVESEALTDGSAPNILARISDTVAPITSSAFTVAQSKVADSSEASLVVRFLASMYGANKFLRYSINAECSISAIAAQLGVSQDIAKTEYASVVDSFTGEVSPGGNFTVSEEGILNDFEIRQKFGGFANLAADFDVDEALTPGTGKLIDYALRDEAVALFLDSPYYGNCTCSND